jgi:uncharacterized membrane protein YqgA involved in biofilm formation
VPPRLGLLAHGQSAGGGARFAYRIEPGRKKLNMRIKFTLITGISLGLMLCGFYLAFAQNEAFLGKRAFFTLMGILGWLIGNKLIELEDRLEELEERAAIAKEIDAPARLEA